MNKRTTVRSLIAVAVVAGGLLVHTTAAQAVPSNCTSKIWEGSGSQSGWQGNCGTLTSPPNDQWQVVATCTRENNQNIHVTVYGPWVGGIGSWSVAHCALNYYGDGGHVNTRDI